MFVSDRDGGDGGADPTPPRARRCVVARQNLGPAVNSRFADFAARVQPDGKYLFFTSERPGIVPTPATGARPPGDIYQIEVAALGI